MVALAIGRVTEVRTFRGRLLRGWTLQLAHAHEQDKHHHCRDEQRKQDAAMGGQDLG
jgi:hypothetical protein